MSASEFAEWMAFDLIDPIGERRADWRSGMIAYLIARTMGGAPDDVTVQTYMYPVGKLPDRAKSQDEVESDMRHFFAAHRARKVEAR